MSDILEQAETPQGISDKPEQAHPSTGKPSKRGEMMTQWNPQSFRARDPRTKAPFLAAGMSLIPGLGQIYVGYYKRGFVNPIIVGFVIGLLVSSANSTSGNNPPFYFPLGILFLIFFWFYNIIDAWRRAMMYNLALEGIENITLPDDIGSPGLGGSVFGGSVLLLAGGVALLFTAFDVPLEVLERWWPLAPMSLGGYLILKDLLEKQK